MKERAFKLIIKAAVVLALGLGYAIFVNLTGIGIPCFFHTITGLYCPGCGISRMCLSLLSGDIAGAASSNIVIFCLLPFFAIFGIYDAYKYIRFNDTRDSPLQNALLIIALVILLAFGVVRNIFHYDILIP